MLSDEIYMLAGTAIDGSTENDYHVNASSSPASSTPTYPPRHVVHARLHLAVMPSPFSFDVAGRNCLLDPANKCQTGITVFPSSSGKLLGKMVKQEMTSIILLRRA